MERIEDFETKLTDGVEVLDRDSETSIVSDSHVHRYLVLDHAEAALARRFKGCSLREVAYQAFLEHSRVPFGKLKFLVRDMASKGLLENSEKGRKLFGVSSFSLKDKLRQAANPTLFRFRSRKSKPSVGGSGNRSGIAATPVPPAVFGLISLAVLVIFGFPELDHIFVPDGNPALGLGIGYLAAFLVLTLRATGRAWAAHGAGVRGVPKRIAVMLGIIYFDPGSAGYNLAPRRERLSAAAMGITLPWVISSGMYMLGQFLSGVDAPIARFFDLAYVVTIGILFLDLCPIGPTSANEAFSSFTKKKQVSQSGFAYLKNKIFKRLFKVEFFDEEPVLILYITWAIIWCMLAFSLNVRLAEGNLLPLIKTLTADPSPGGLIVIGIFMLGLIFVTAVTIGGLITLLAGIVSSALPQFKKRRNPFKLESLEPEKVMQSLRQVPLFSRTDGDLLRNIAERVERVGFSRGTSLIKQGEEGQELFILLEGTAEVVLEEESGLERQLAGLAPGDAFGETALLESVPRTASVRGLTDGVALKISREDFAAVVEVGEGNDLMAIIRGANILRSSPLFSELEPDAMAHLLGRLNRIQAEEGQVICRRGEEGDNFYLVMEGSFDVMGEDEESVVATLEKGDPFGEIALLENIPRTATIVTRRAGSLLSLSRNAFYEFFHRNLSAGEQLEMLGAKRLMAKGG